MSNWKVFWIVVMQLYFAEKSRGWLFTTNNNCYHSPINVGCFPTTGHYTNAMGFAPQSPREVDVKFVYKGDSGNVIFRLWETQQRMRNVFDSSLKTVFIIHGFLESHTRPWIIQMVNALKAKEPMNVFVVDWRAGAYNINYLQCVANARMAGAVTGLFLQEFIQHFGASPSTFHIIGFSLGAQVAGYVGERVQGIGRITGLDPAGPGFTDVHPLVRLDPTDAVVVDVVHTDNDIGTLQPLGTIDFYPNGGSDQPSCGAMSRLSTFVRQFDFSQNSVSRTIGCSHKRAPELFTSSISTNCIYVLMGSPNVRSMRIGVGNFCLESTCPTFGYDLDYSQTPRPGIYRFATSGSHPYC